MEEDDRYLNAILLSNVAEISESAIKEAVEIAEDVTVVKLVVLSDGQVLITVQADRDLDIDHISIGHEQCPVDRVWHNVHPSVVCARGLPPTVNEGFLEAYLEGQGVETKNIVISKEEETANIELVNPLDLPYLICKTHKLRKQSVEFVEASIAPIEVHDFVQDSLPAQQNLFTFHEPQALKLVIISSQMQIQEDVFKESIVYLFSNSPYFLKVDKFQMQDNEAYVTFVEEEGIIKVMNAPPATLLAAPVKVSTVPLREIQFSPEPPDPSSVLLIDNLPANIPTELMKVQLEFMFKQRGFEMTECRMEKKCAYFMFSDQNAIPNLIANPPDNSTLCGHPIRYTSSTGGIGTPAPGPCLLLVQGLPSGFTGVRQALEMYLTNVTKVRPVSCVADGRQATVKFEDDQVAKQLAQAPPTTSFFEKTLEFSTVIDPSPSSQRDRAASESHISTRGMRQTLTHSQYSIPSWMGSSYSTNQTTPTSSIDGSVHPTPAPRKPRPRAGPKNSDLVIRNVPDGYGGSTLSNYLVALTGKACKEVKLKSGIALVKMLEPIDIEPLRSKLATDMFDGHLLTVEPLEPSNNILLTSTKKLKAFDVKMYCRKHCGSSEVEVEEKSATEFVVTFKTVNDLESFQRKAKHEQCIGDKNIKTVPYHRVLAKFEETDVQPTEPDDLPSDTPPPLPPRTYINVVPTSTPVQQAYYQYLSHRVTLSEAEKAYMMHRLSQLNTDLIQVHGEARIEDNKLEVRPLHLATTMPDWEDKVMRIVKKHKVDFQTASIPMKSGNIKAPVLEYLICHQQKHKEFHFSLDENQYKIAGSSSSISEALEYIHNLVEEEIEVTRELQQPPRYVDYFMKFAKDEIESVQPHVTITRNKDNSGLLSVKGVKKSLDVIEKLAHEKLAQLHTEFVPLTQTAHRLISGRRGKAKLTDNLGTTMDVICYVFEKIEKKEEFTHHVCIMSSDSASLAIAKRMFESLCKEEKIFLPQDKLGLSSTQEWQTIVDKLGNEYFASVRTSGEIITITGSDTDIMKVSHEIRTFLETQNEATEEFTVAGPVWQVVRTQQTTKLTEVRKKAERHKVYLSLPDVDEDAKSVIVGLQGNLQYVQNVKVQLQHMVDEIQTKEVVIPPKPGVQRVIDRGTISTKCHDLSRFHKVVIRYEVEEESSIRSQPMFSGNKQNMLNAPQRLINATSSSGVSVCVYKGDYAKRRCDALVTFIPEKPSFKESVFTSLSNVGGDEMQHDFEMSLGLQNLLPATIHRTRFKGDLECNEIFHVVLSHFSPGNQHKFQNTLNAMLVKVLESASMNNSRILLCPLTVAPLNYPADVFAQALVCAVSSSNIGMYSADLSIEVFVDDSHESDEFEQVMRDGGFQIYHHRNRSETVLVSAPKITAQRGTASSLEKVIKITKGNILDLQTDVYINSTSPELDFSSGSLSDLFRRKCGKTLVNEVNDYLKHEGKLAHGKVAVTSANGLKAKAIYHIALKRKDEADYERSFRTTVENILLTAKDNGHRSIAIPCLGVANLGYSAELSARVLFEAVVSFHYKYPSAITEFHFVVYRKSDEKPFFDEYEKRVKQMAKLTTPVQNFAGRGKPDLGSLKIEIFKGNLAREQTEVIVNSTSIDIKEGANQISKAIFQFAGDDMRNACSSLVSSGLLLADGIVVPTSASGELRCDKVYHVHVPGKAKRDVPPTSAEASLVKKVIYNCLEMADNNRHESMSFPAFCLGIGNYTIEESGGLMFEAFEDFVKTSPQHLKTVRIIIHDQTKHNAFLEYFKGYFSNVSSGATPEAFHTFLSPSLIRKSRSATSPFANLPQMPLCQRSSIHFKIYGIRNETLAMVEKELVVFINEAIVTDMVDLGTTAKLFHESDLKKVYELAGTNGVEIEVQPELERIIVSGEEGAVERVCNKVQLMKVEFSSLINELQFYEWFTEDSKSGHSELYPAEAMMQIEVAHKRNLPSIEITVDDIPVTVDLMNMEEFDSKAGLKRRVVRRRKAVEVDLPPEWCKQPTDSRGGRKVVHFEKIPPSSWEYTKATKRFNETLKGAQCTIHSVHRVQNPGEYSRYLTLKTSWEGIHGHGVVKEKELFHGTKEDSVSSICSQGFNRIFAADANAAHFGKGVYFALNAWYSLQDKYSAKDKNGHKHILVCTLLVGHYTKGDKTMKIAPPLPDNPQVLYDTLVDNPDAPTIFVAMKDSQAYPRYWITLTKDK